MSSNYIWQYSASIQLLDVLIPPKVVYPVLKVWPGSIIDIELNKAQYDMLYDRACHSPHKHLDMSLLGRLENSYLLSFFAHPTLLSTAYKKATRH